MYPRTIFIIIVILAASILTMAGRQLQGDLRVSVVDASTGDPLEQVLVRLGPLAATRPRLPGELQFSDSGGICSWTGLPPGFYRLTAQAPGYQELTRKIKIEEDMVVQAGKKRFATLTIG